MENCNICYESLLDKVIFKCKHELCIKCFLKIIDKKKHAKCHMCRKKYNWIPIEAEDSKLKPIITESFPLDECSFYKAGSLHYVLLSDYPLETNIAKEIIKEHIQQCSSSLHRNISIELLESNVSIKTENVDFYVQDYCEVIIKRIITQRR